MKKLFYLVPVLGMLMSSCSSEEPLPGDKNNNGEELVTNYISINIVPASGLGSRAEGDNVQGTDGADGTYRDGSESENQVNRVRFFFFDDDKQATPVKANMESYIDWYPSEGEKYGESIPNETVEKTFTATLGIFNPDEDKYSNPAYVVAVINPSPAALQLSGTNGTVLGPSLKEVQNCLSDYKTTLTDNNFVMSNSVYATNNTEGNNTEFIATSLDKVGDGTYFKASIEAALNDPVTIYVERVVARLDLWIDLQNPTILDENTTIYQLKLIDPVTNDETHQVTIDGEKQDIYIKFLGWNVTSAPMNSNLLKTINPAWTSNGLFGATDLAQSAPTAWTNPAFHRSFWAMNPSGVEIEFGNFNGAPDENNINPATGVPMPQGNKTATIYLQENASPYNAELTANAPTSPSKVILACQLVDENGNAIQLAEWGFRKFTIDNLTTYLLGTICKGNNYYYKTVEAGNDGATITTFHPLTKNEVRYITATQLYGDMIPENVKRYYSYMQLTEDAATKYEWYDGNTLESKTVEAKEINDYLLKTVNYCMIWTEGYSYYYFDIHHLGAPGSIGYNGIIRNHIYDTHVKSILGIGTPVFDPNETIYPEKPEYEESIIAAEIKILQWRVVSNNYDIKW